MENPYKEAKDMGMWKWMLKHQIGKMIFTFVFVSIFVVAPWIGAWKIEPLWLRILLSSCMLIINFAVSFLRPILIYNGLIKNHDRWENNYGKDKKK